MMVPGPFDAKDIMNIFMINGINADLLKAFYAAGGQELDDVLRLHDNFCGCGSYIIKPDQKTCSEFSGLFSRIISKQEPYAE